VFNDPGVQHADLGGHPGTADFLLPGISHVSARYLRHEHRVRVVLQGQHPSAKLEISLSPGQWRQVLWAITTACPLVTQDKR